MDSKAIGSTNVSVSNELNLQKEGLFDCQTASKAANRPFNLTNLLYKLVNGFDSFERHLLAAEFIKARNVRTVLDLGGLKGRVHSLLGPAEVSIDIANIAGDADIVYDGHTLPVPDNSYECLVTLDVLEHVPPTQRPGFLRECLRVAEKYVFLSVPYRTDLHVAVEKKLCELFLRARREDHPFLREHIENGLVNEQDFFQYLTDAGINISQAEYKLFFTGDTVEIARSQETALELKISSKTGYLLNLPQLFLSRSGLGEKLHCGTHPTEETNRLYAIIGKVRRD